MERRPGKVSQEVLHYWARERGYRIAWGPPDVLAPIETEMAERQSRGQVGGILAGYLAGFRYLRECGLKVVRSVGVLAVPSPAYQITFETEEGVLDALVPPVYVNIRLVASSLICELSDVLHSVGEYTAVPLRVPLKLLGSRLGLLQYGRHNITFARGLGTYHQLLAFATDADLGGAALPNQSSDSLSVLCDNCDRCLKACPTGALPVDRFMLVPERCVAALNAMDGAWPAWLPEDAHSCLVGCLACQEACPRNSGLLRIERVPESIAPAETAAILLGRLPEREAGWLSAKQKLAAAGITLKDSILTRNLRALIKRRRVLWQAARA